MAHGMGNRNLRPVRRRQGAGWHATLYLVESCARASPAVSGVNRWHSTPQVDTGLLTLEAYLDQLREAIAKDKARSAELKAAAKEGAGPVVARAALDAYKRALVMQAELDEALSEVG
mmetsp:Transcript_26168/g.73300  ORF Transcript_26168/g.73300 Transcript_26168/m.73300 type:complete len:117 (+) Transcript_26168:1187-1537(+)